MVPRPLDDRALPGAVLERVARTWSRWPAAPIASRPPRWPKWKRAPVEALHLAEAALAAEAGPPGRARCEPGGAPSTPRGRATNFWETRWLEDRIRTLELKRAES
jgi:hypothetical protein